MNKYAETARKYQLRVQKNKTITLRFEKENNRVISARTQASVNAETGTLCVSAALWYRGKVIYASEK